MNDAPPVPIEKEPKSLISNLSIVWIIPALALVTALFVAWQSYNARGPVITVEFENAAGIVPRETEVRFRDVQVGLVEEVMFSEGLSSVVAKVRLDKSVAPYVDSTASFWIVRPEFSASGISGLDTVLSGVFIQGSWDSTIGPPASAFKGLDRAPLYQTGSADLQIALRSLPGGTLSADTPILYRGIEIGRVGPARISPEGNFAIAEAVIYEPHGRLITPSTRFWDASGFSFTIGPAGAEIDFTSVASLLGGGITFDTFVSGGEQVGDGSVFEVFPSETDARNSVFNASEVDLLEVRVIFDENISGLTLGAPVELSGLRIGSVENLSGVVDPETYGDSRVRLAAVLGIQPARLGLPEEVTPQSALMLLEEQVRNGLRARLASTSILTGGLKVELVQLPDAPPALVEVFEGSIPRMPTAPSEISDAAASVEGVFTRINRLPIEEVLTSVTDFLRAAENLLTSEDLRAAPQDLRGLLGDIRGVVTSQTVQDIPVTLNVALVRLDGILAQIEEQQGVARILASIDAATSAATAVGTSIEGLPDLVTELAGVAAEAASLPLADLTQQVTDVLASADAVVSAPAMQELPASLAGALDELNRTLAELREGGAVDNVNATLRSTRNAADAVALSAQDLPDLVDRITQVFDEASATIAGYNRGEVLSRDAQAALRDISQASNAISSLARLLERNPSALIRGR
ncbi:MCE family protein [Roseobacter denitrificans]|uniref:Paraquat-inducible protein B, putative n=1 Tax=Roseobacter denitrificans (strain ATCC 33942 / OCh 114) TaxID=375451 RepID=Q16DY0_ROSDO|nr:MlaD family protein [Roseobacter denitrificans]ABG29813.1 paraquat-inducible protein B, putative [Roseobacter denitrificans OCh 114]AVL53038.1 MCE family protein [Roseobacter denitrificans]SFG26573.1 paraquat-inducible protein B [Roseobacter denitrificans OCh 114]